MSSSSLWSSSVAFVIAPFVLVTAATACGSSSPSNTQPAAVAAPPDPGTVTPPSPDPDPATPPAKCPDGATFTTIAGKLVVQAALADGPAQSFILDTGAPSSVLDQSIVAKYPSISKLKVTIAGVDRTISFDSTDLQAGFGPSIVGILGKDVFAPTLTIDYPRARFWIEDAVNEAALLACSDVKGTPVSVDMVEDNYFFVQGNAEGAPGWFAVDSGASYGATRKTFFEMLDAAHSRPRAGGFYTPAAVGTFWADVATIGYFEVSGQRVSHISTRTIDDNLLQSPPNVASADFIGVLPSGFLHHFMVTLDTKQKKLRLDAAKQGDMSEESAFYPTGISLETVTTGPVHVTAIIPGSSAAEQGIAVGDEIVSIEGKAIATIDPELRGYYLSPTQDKASVPVSINHAGVETPYTLEARDVLTAPTAVK